MAKINAKEIQYTNKHQIPHRIHIKNPKNTIIPKKLIKPIKTFLTKNRYGIEKHEPKIKKAEYTFTYLSEKHNDLYN